MLTTKIVLQNYPQGYIEFLLNFLWNLCIPSWLGENFQIYGVSINGKMHLQFKKLNLDIFTHAPPSKDFPQVLTITLQAEGNYRFPRSRVLPKTNAPPPPPRHSRKRGRKLCCENIKKIFHFLSFAVTLKLSSMQNIPPCSYCKAQSTEA